MVWEVEAGRVGQEPQDRGLVVLVGGSPGMGRHSPRGTEGASWQQGKGLQQWSRPQTNWGCERERCANKRETEAASLSQIPIPQRLK